MAIDQKKRKEKNIRNAARLRKKRAEERAKKPVKEAPALKYGKQAKKFALRDDGLGMTDEELKYVRKCRRSKEIPRLGTPAMGGSWGLAEGRPLP